VKQYLNRKIDRSAHQTGSMDRFSVIPSPYDITFENGFESLLCFCVSTEMLAIYSTAVAERQMMRERHIHVVDTLHLTMGQVLMVLYTALKHGLSVHSWAGMVWVCVVSE
jgi:fatty acid-binding protein DegV